MSGITDWQEALTDPRFWACRYGFPFGKHGFVDGPVPASFFSLTEEQCEDYFLRLFGDEDFDSPLPPYVAYEYVPASILTLSLPEHYTWALEFGGCGIAHEIGHPEVFPNSELIAEESGHFLLPGLRWTELNQIVACLEPEWAGPGEVSIIYPLLYPVVDMITLPVYEEVRQTLKAAWEALRLIEPAQLERWLDETIVIYDQGRVLHWDGAQGWYDPLDDVEPQLHGRNSLQGSPSAPLWIPDPAGGWYTRQACSTRQNARTFAQFFEMLERQTHRPQG